MGNLEVRVECHSKGQHDQSVKLMYACVNFFDRRHDVSRSPNVIQHGSQR